MDSVGRHLNITTKHVLKTSLISYVKYVGDCILYCPYADNVCVFAGSRWRVKDLTYKISKYPRILSKSDTDEEVRKAFSVWASVTSLTFTQKKSGPVHIEIRFERGEHGDGDPFDGPGGTLAHAFFPVYGGDAHFDDAEKWTVNTYRGMSNRSLHIFLLACKYIILIRSFSLLIGLYLSLIHI